MRKQRAAAALALTLLLLLCPARARAQEAPQGSWCAAALVEQSTGRVLYAENGDEELPMASTTKIMTALCAVESGRLGEAVEIDRRMVGIEGSSIYLEAGERLTVEELTYGLMLRSGNDAAVALAIALGGSVEGFAAQMNERAAQLGLAHTQFTNPTACRPKGTTPAPWTLRASRARPMRTRPSAALSGRNTPSSPGRAMSSTAPCATRTSC